MALYAGLMGTVARGVMPAEVNSPEYLRQAVSLDEMGSNINAITFPTALTEWGKIDEIALFDAIIAGKKVASQKIPSFVIKEGDVCNISPQILQIVDGCTFSKSNSPFQPNAKKFSWTDASPISLFTSYAEKTILVIRIFIEEPFNLNTVISIGDSNNPEQLVPHTMIYPNEVGEYSLSIGFTYPIDTPVLLFISQSTHGSGSVFFTLEP